MHKDKYTYRLHVPGKYIFCNKEYINYSFVIIFLCVYLKLKLGFW